MRTGAGLMGLQCFQCARSSRASFEAGGALYEIQAKDVLVCSHTETLCIAEVYEHTVMINSQIFYLLWYYNSDCVLSFPTYIFESHICLWLEF